MALKQGCDTIKLRMDVVNKDGENIAELNYKHVVSSKEELMLVEQTVVDGIMGAYKVIGDTKLGK